MGRRKAKIKVDIETLVHTMAKDYCPDTDIALVLGISESTMRRRFDALLKQGRAECRCDLRAAQVRHALAGSGAMLVWLGKNILGQQDNPPAIIPDDADILYETEWGRPEDEPREAD